MRLGKKLIPLLIAMTTILAACGESGKPYPLDKCLVTDNALGSMGDPVSTVYKGQEVKFCCKPCIRKFNADPEMYLRKLSSTNSKESGENK